MIHMKILILQHLKLLSTKNHCLIHLILTVMSIPLTLPTSHSNNLTSSSSVSHNGNNASPHSSNPSRHDSSSSSGPPSCSLLRPLSGNESLRPTQMPICIGIESDDDCSTTIKYDSNEQRR